MMLFGFLSKWPLLNQSAKVGFFGSSTKKSVPTPLHYEASTYLCRRYVFVRILEGDSANSHSLPEDVRSAATPHHSSYVHGDFGFRRRRITYAVRLTNL
jgi:hypothetical protein